MQRGIACGFLCVLLVGCQRPVPSPFRLSSETQGLPAAQQAEVERVLIAECGTPQSPKILGTTASGVAESRRLLQGQAVYLKRCVQCHGDAGDGEGPVARFLYPLPRDYRRGIFKFTSTPTGFRARREDLQRTLQRGIPGTSMPSFKLLPEQELNAVLDYVLMLTHRGELEFQLAELVKSGEEIPPGGEEREILLKDAVDLVLSRWTDAEAGEFLPLSPQPRFTAEHVDRGRVAFQKRECFKCHGPDGRAQNEESLKSKLKDDWGHATRAADLTSGMLRGGGQPLDVYRRIHSGVKGTPMPGHAQMLAAEPDTLWDLTAFVLYVAHERRRNKTPESGDLLPFPVFGSGSP